MGGGGGDWDWEDYSKGANAIIKPQFDCTICSARIFPSSPPPKMGVVFFEDPDVCLCGYIDILTGYLCVRRKATFV